MVLWRTTIPSEGLKTMQAEKNAEQNREFVQRTRPVEMTVACATSHPGHDARRQISIPPARSGYFSPLFERLNRTHRQNRSCYGLKFLFLMTIFSGTLQAQVEPDRSGLGQAGFRVSELNIHNDFRLPGELPDQAAPAARTDLAVLGLSPNSGRVDVRGGRWANLMMSEPLLPGQGKGNRLGWANLGKKEPVNDAELAKAASEAFRGFVHAANREFRIDLAELANPGKVTLHENGQTIQIYVPRVHKGVSVRDSYLTATIKHGNMTVFGANNWGDINISVVPTISKGAALEAIQSHVGSYTINGSWRSSELQLIPLARGKNPKAVSFGKGYDYSLAWVIRPDFDGEQRHFEALVDAHTGQLLSFEDTNQYVATQRNANGGVLPVSNDGVSPDGIEHPGWPMPFEVVTTPGGPVTTDSGGNLPAPVDGNITSHLSGPYVNINDNCGAISLTSSGDIDFGSSTGTDCVTPGFGGAGNTHASRTGFHELNRIIEMGRSHLPSNTWLQQTLTSNMNINQSCNAFWGGGTVNFYRSGSGCANTGELAGVFDHEWGHGLDDNDAIPSIAGPSGEGIADVYSALRLNASCMGRNFTSNNCSGFGDPCLACTGVRDIDYLKRASGQPHDYSWSNANCGGSVHCTGAVYSEAIWSLWKRKLQAPPYNLDEHTAHEIVTRLTFIGGGNTGTWYSGSPPNGGCAATSGYMNYLAADDDNGDLSDGTPHMQAIFDAFNDQEIACTTPVVQDSGCAGSPVTAPVVVANPFDKSAMLSWGPVAGTSSYEVFRTDGVFGCDFGKTRVGHTTGTSFTDDGLQNGRDYFYVVIPKGGSSACFGPASSCTMVSPAAGPNVDIDPASSTLATLTGDGDTFIDNCEDATLTFDVNNTGLGSLTNVRITSVTSSSHPATIINTTFPAAVSPSTLAQGATGSGSFDFTAAGLVFGDTLVFEVTVTSDEIFPGVKTRTLTLTDAESDVQALSSKTWDFESGMDGWTLIDGTFNQTTAGGGANGSSGYLASSALIDERCDQVRSPTMQLTPTSTLTLENNYDIEANSGQWWDRANIGVVENGNRSAVNPDGGRLYNASGAGATCATTGQEGWADVNNTWGPSSWTASALGSVALAGTPIQLDVAYGTDFSVVGQGFWFDQVTVTDIELIVADAQSDSCVLVNIPPTVTIASPADGATIVEGANINFTGSASDTEDGDISANIDWSSSIDGPLDTGASINVASLSVGVHTIAAEVTDSGDPTAMPEMASDQITVTIIVNTPPTVEITAPANGTAVVEGANINFTGNATDTEDGNISANISWSSSIDGALGAGASINTASLSVGVHTIDAGVTDSGGLSDSDQITVTVVTNTPPAVTITDPDSGSDFNQGVNINFTGNATDAEDGNINANISWSSSIDGALGTGASINTASLSVGVHLINADVTDSGGLPGNDQITVTIVANTPPTVAITAPASGSNFDEGVNINFTGSATDTEDGNISANISWSSSIDGALGTGANINTASLSVGVHLIDAGVTDSGGLPGNEQITVTVNAPPAADVHVENIVTGITNAPRGRKYGTASVTIYDENGVPVSAGYTVTGNFSGSYSDPGMSAVTNGSGVAFIVTSSTAKKNIVVNFCVSDVTGALSYDPGDNADPGYGCAGNMPPTVAISAPASGSDFNQGVNINFTGNATDTEDGNISANISWSSSINGALGTGASINTASLSVGVHTIDADVTDSGGLSASDQITVTVNPPAGLTDVHVEVIQTGTQGVGGGFKAGIATVTIFGDNGAPQAGYTVSGEFSGDFNETPPADVTGADGKVTFQTLGTKKGRTNVSFCVSNVSGTEPYDSGDNPDPAFACTP